MLILIGILIYVAVLIALLGKYIDYRLTKLTHDIQQVKTSQRASQKRELKLLKGVRKK